MRILVTGSRGQLGRELLGCGPQRGHEVRGVDIDECDITDRAAVAALLGGAPAWDALINCSAYTKVDQAESESELAHAVNGVAPGILAEECAKTGTRLLHISTDFVFDGSATSPIDESASPNPLSVYGTTKLEGEVAVRAAGPDHLIVRTSWLYGQNGPNFVLTMLRLARERPELKVVGDQHGSPTWTGDLAPALLRLLELGAKGTFHLTNSGATTWHGLASEVIHEAGIEIPVHAITTDQYPTPATRPAYSVLANGAWAELGEPPLPDWREAVHEYMAQIRAPR